MIKEKYDAVIACGGLGTRLKEITDNIPKPLYPINGKSTIERCIDELSNYQFDNLLITVGYKSDLFSTSIEKLKSKYKLNIDIFIEEEPLGECGALWNIKDRLKDDFLFINGDLIFSVDFNKLFFFHRKASSYLTLVTHTTDHPFDSDLVSAPNGSLIEEIFMKNHNNKIERNAYLGNSGICVIKKKILNALKGPLKKESKSIFHFMVKNSFKLGFNIYSYNTTEYIKDIGTPKRFKKVEKDLRKNIVEKKNYKNLQKALFLDRDKTLIECPIGQYIIDKNEVKLIKKNIYKIIEISHSYDFVCVVTNQPTISMGKLTIKELDEINSFIVKACLSMGLKIDVITFCPHHPSKGFKGELDILKTVCFCRKPNPGMILEQAFYRNINLKDSLMIGDSENDFLAAKNAGCKYLGVFDL